VKTAGTIHELPLPVRDVLTLAIGAVSDRAPTAVWISIMRTAASEHGQATDSSAQVSDQRPSSGCGRTLRRLVVVFLCLVIAFLLRNQWLPIVAYPLLAPTPQHLNEVTLIWVHTHDGRGFAGDGVVERTASLLKAYPKANVIFTQGWSSRLVEMGVIPPPVEILRRALADYQIPSERVTQIDVAGYQFWNAARAMDAYLSEHPQERVVLLTSEFGGRSHSLVLRAAMSAPNRDRVDILGLPDFRYSHHDWWKSRAGVKGLMVGYLYLIYTVFQPQPVEPIRKLTLDDFDKLIPDLSEKAP